ncbi:MAG TPA: DegT/DnrJ/EryC1/StrS family aminotransferase [Actinomycetes bacterium]|nr:DegT/DnrJ/EryC1/StrS family aminotransferase [Actinomycetes bacterium]
MTALPDLSVETDRVPFARTEIGPDAVTAAARVLASGWVTAGPEVVDFERELAAYLGLRADQALAVSSCTAAIELALRGLALPPGSKVLTPTITFCGAVHAIVNAGLEPVLVDCDPETLAPDAATTAAAAGERGGADAMVVLHFAGYPSPVGELAAAAGLPLSRVVEDAAHAIGTWVGERPVGTISAATCFSFYATKNLPIGEGGMVTTTDPDLADFVKRARLHGMSRDAWKRYLPGNGWRYAVETEGLKANMTDVQAAIGRAQLRRFDGWQARREELARRYEANLAGIGGIRPAPRPAAGRHAWHLYVIQVEPEFGMARDAFVERLAERGVDCSVHFIPLHHQPYFRKLLGDRAGRFPAADAAFERIVSLPFYPSLRDDQVDRVCEAIADLRLATPTAPARTAL